MAFINLFFLKAAYDLSNEAKNRSLGEMSRVNDLIAKIEGFTSGDKATPEDVKTLANEVKISLLTELHHAWKTNIIN